MDLRTEICFIMILLIQLLNRKNKRICSRTCWVKPYLRENIRSSHGAFSTLFRYFKTRDPKGFYDFVGISVPQFQKRFNGMY